MLKSKIKKIPRARKRLIMIVGDFLIIPGALWVAITLRFGEVYIPHFMELGLIIIAPLIAIPIFINAGMYRAIIHFMEMKALWTIFKSVTLAILVWCIVFLLMDSHAIPRSSVINFWFLSLLFVGGSRVGMRWLLATKKVVNQDVPKLAIYGAGFAGVQLLAALKHSPEFSVVGFIDDNSELIHHDISGLRVYALAEIKYLIEKKNISQVMIAIPSMSRSQRRILVQNLEPYPVEVRILPGFSEMAKGNIDLNDIRDVSIEDLLGRDSVNPDLPLLKKTICKKSVMVTGAGGSIGSELCRQILKNKPSMLVLFEQNEFALYSIEKELSKTYPEIKIIPILGSVMHQHRVEHVCRTFAVNIIYHAAAYKHVPLVEFNPIEAVQNNIFGTWRTACAAVAAGVENFVLVSTDKAVRPTNVMGATKRFAELILQAMAIDNGRTRFCMVRFGNVLGSSGSVVPLFRQQIKDGGPVTVTHPEITRYFMTIPEAAQLVIQAGAMSQGGDVFVLDMGESVKIIDLASKIIRLSGLTVRNEENPEGDIEINYTGLRPGEKLYEELLIGDNVTGTDHPLIMRAQEITLELEEVEQLMKDMMSASHSFDVQKVRDLLCKAVREYQPQCAIQDLTFTQSDRVLKTKLGV